VGKEGVGPCGDGPKPALCRVWVTGGRGTEAMWQVLEELVCRVGKVLE
jgi:hypothetical protein